MIGGFALNAYHVSRQTADVDFLIQKKDYATVLTLLEKEGFSQDYAMDNFARLRGDRNYLMDIDFMFVDASTFGKIKNDAETFTIARNTFEIPSLLHLIALKLHSIKNNPKRELKDLPDIINLVMTNKVNLSDKSFKAMCLKYGSETLYRKIAEACG